MMTVLPRSRRSEGTRAVSDRHRILRARSGHMPGSFTVPTVPQSVSRTQPVRYGPSLRIVISNRCVGSTGRAYTRSESYGREDDL